MNERIVERNELAKQLFANLETIEAAKAVSLANAMMEELYGKEWNEEPAIATVEATLNDSEIGGNDYYTHDIFPTTISGKKWLRIKALDEDFLLAMEDLNVDGMVDELNKDEIQSELKKHGWQELTKRQGLIVCALLDDINERMAAAGGEKFAADWYACADYGGYGTWCFSGTGGCLGNGNRCSGRFRCRPVLALPLQS